MSSNAYDVNKSVETGTWGILSEKPSRGLKPRGVTKRPVTDNDITISEPSDVSGSRDVVPSPTSDHFERKDRCDGVVASEPLLITDTRALPANRVLVFVDEIKHSQSSGWAYVGVVSVPQSRVGSALNALLGERDRVGYHRELHFSEIKKRGEKVDLAMAWLTLLMDDPRTWHFGIVGFDMSRLCLPAFGERKGEQFANSYRRFLRSALAFHLKTAHCGKGSAEVAAIYHDRNGQLEADPYFDWHAIRWLDAREGRLSFQRDHIIFVDSDHDAPQGHQKASHFIQLVDVLLGATRHAIERPTGNRGKDIVAQHFLPLVERLNHKRDWRNPNGRYRHYPRCQLSYFPRRELTLDMLQDASARMESGFYRGRALGLADLHSQQLLLDLTSERL